MKCYENIKEMVKIKNLFDLVKPQINNDSLSKLKKNVSIKLVFSIDNVNLHLTEYLYNISLF